MCMLIYDPTKPPRLIGGLIDEERGNIDGIVDMNGKQVKENKN